MARYINTSFFALCLIGASPQALAFDDDDISLTVTVDYVTEYVFRGVSLASDAIQPSVELNIGGFTAGIWGSTGLGDNSELAADEVDFYLGYEDQLNEMISYNVGATYYHYPQFGDVLETDDGQAGSYEVYAGLGFDYVLSPAVTAYYDITLETFTLEGSIGHSFEIGLHDTRIDLGLTGGHVDFDGGDYQYGTASAAYVYGYTDDVAAYIGLNYTLNSEDFTLGFSEGAFPNGDPFAFRDGDDLFWGGVGITAGF